MNKNLTVDPRFVGHKTNNGKEGWDGTFKGAEQAPGTYVWYAEGTDYLNNKLTRKGTVVLIR